MNTSVEEAWLACRRQPIYLKADDLDQWPRNQTPEPLTVARPKALEAFNSFRLSPKKEGKPEVILDYLEGHGRPHHGKAYERFLFRTRFQELREPLEDFVTDLHYKSHFCNFGDQRESMVRDQVIVGCRHSLVRQELPHRDIVGLEEALRICRWAEVREPEDSCRHLQTSSDEEKTSFQERRVKEKKRQTSRRKARLVRMMGKKPNQEVGSRPRKESFKTWV